MLEVHGRTELGMETAVVYQSLEPLLAPTVTLGGWLQGEPLVVPATPWWPIPRSQCWPAFGKPCRSTLSPPCQGGWSVSAEA